MKNSADGGYVCLRVRSRRFVGPWQALQNIIVPVMSVLGRRLDDFSIPVNHLKFKGTPNRFAAVSFRKMNTLFIIDTKGLTSAKPIRHYEAYTAELVDVHISLLVSAIIENGCCQERHEHKEQQNMHRL